MFHTEQRKWVKYTLEQADNILFKWQVQITALHSSTVFSTEENLKYSYFEYYNPIYHWSANYFMTVVHEVQHTDHIYSLTDCHAVSEEKTLITSSHPTNWAKCNSLFVIVLSYCMLQHECNINNHILYIYYVDCILSLMKTAAIALTWDTKRPSDGNVSAPLLYDNMVFLQHCNILHIPPTCRVSHNDTINNFTPFFIESL